MTKPKNNPTQNKQKKNSSVRNKFTRIDFSYINNYDKDGWVHIQPDSFIRPVGTKTIYPLVKAQGIPIAPQKHYFKRKGEKISYTLFFPSLPKDVKKIDIIEKEDGSDNFFNFYGISIEKIKEKKIQVNPVFDTGIRFDRKKIYACEMLSNGYYPNERTIAVLRLGFDRKGEYHYRWHILDNAGNIWNAYQTFEEAWAFQGMNMLGKKIFNNQKDFFKWAFLTVRKNKLY